MRLVITASSDAAFAARRRAASGQGLGTALLGDNAVAAQAPEAATPSPPLYRPPERRVSLQLFGRSESRLEYGR